MPFITLVSGKNTLHSSGHWKKCHCKLMVSGEVSSYIVVDQPFSIRVPPGVLRGASVP